MAIRHVKRIRRQADPTAGVVPTADHWNDVHNSPDFVILALHPSDTMLDPYVSEEPVEYGYMGEGLPIGWQTRFDFAFVDAICIEVASSVASTTLRGEYRAQYSPDEGVTWRYFDGISGPRVDVSSEIHSNTVLRGAWVDVAEAAKIDALVRIVSFNSDGNSIQPGHVTVWGR